MRTLIVDDEEPIVYMLSRLCRDEGHVVLPFTQSAKALAYLASEPVDLLLTDLHMPDPDGVAVMLEARRLQPRLFTIIITGHTERYPIEDVLGDGYADIIFKPFRMNELRARLALAERRRRLIDRLHDETQQLQMVGNASRQRRPGRCRGIEHQWRGGRPLEVVVTELARSEVTASTTTYTSPDQIIAIGGSISVALFGNPPIQIPPAGLAGAMSVQDFANGINAQADSPVTASVVQAAPGQYRLVLTGRNSGTANAFTVTSTLDGGAGLTFTDTNNNGTYRDSDAAPYSELMSFLGEQNSAAANGKSNIARDGMVRALKAELRTAMQGEYLAAGMALQQEFIAADLLMTQLEGQGSSLQALNGQYRLF